MSSIHSQRTVLVTGSSGFFGAQVCRVLEKSDWHVLAGHRRTSNQWRLEHLLPPSVHWRNVIFDINDPENVTDFFSRHRVDLIVHCAAYGVDPRQQSFEQAMQTNVMATDRLVQAAGASGVKRFIHVGTAAEYGRDQLQPLCETDLITPKGVYGVSKASATLVALSRAESIALPLVVIRPFGMFGELEGRNKLVPSILEACRSQQVLPLTSGLQVRDYMYVEDAAKACAILGGIEEFPSGEIINLGSGVGIRIRDLGGWVSDVVGGCDSLLGWGMLPQRANEVHSMTASVDKAKRLLGWQAGTPLIKGIERMLDIENNYANRKKL